MFPDTYSTAALQVWCSVAYREVFDLLVSTIHFVQLSLENSEIYKLIGNFVNFHLWNNMIIFQKIEGEIVMNKMIVVFQNLDDIVKFVQKVEKYPYNMDMKRGKYVVDAKSLLGLLNLGVQKEIELNVYEEECGALRKDLEEFVAA